MHEQSLLNDLDHVLITAEEIDLAVTRLGKEITKEFMNLNPVFICILKGASVFFTDLMRKVDLPLTTDFMAISSYGSSTKTSGVVRILKDLDHDILGKDVLVVEDIVDSGLTLSYIKKVLFERGARSIRIATLLDKPARRKIELEVDYACFTIPNEFVVGYGLDYQEKYRNLPFVGVLHPRIYTEEE
ncbi:MAG: hypoxanthine phosphoribosyltransferase [Christensenellales bacterium]|jgi:hypoxanthine phosphoribosyltransferase|nr:hypoxanthine phosphoribosyltransferase [Clostridiales bacterium]HHT08070.1 hypoxanthine phosphoribosyltransferase [Clostridiales bacterium]